MLINERCLTQVSPLGRWPRSARAWSQPSSSAAAVQTRRVTTAVAPAPQPAARSPASLVRRLAAVPAAGQLAHRARRAQRVWLERPALRTQGAPPASAARQALPGSVATLAAAPSRARLRAAAPAVAVARTVAQPAHQVRPARRAPARPQRL